MNQTATKEIENTSEDTVFPTPEALRQRFLALETELNEVVVGRPEGVRGLLTGLLSNNHVFLLGPPGTAKSLLLDSLCHRIGGARIYKRLFTAYTQPEEVFGPVRISGLKQDRFERRIEDYLPDVHLAFIDEVWKAGSPILNTLLKVLNERKFENDTQTLECPLRLALFASNETPASSELEALYDRIALRFLIEESMLTKDWEAMYLGQTRGVDECEVEVSLEELDAARKQVREVRFPVMVAWLARKLGRKLRQEGMALSPRRECQLRLAVQAQAWLDGRDAVNREDLLQPYSATAWRTEEEIAPAQKLIEKTVSPAYYKVRRGLNVVRKAKRNFDRSGKSDDSDYLEHRALALQNVQKVRSNLNRISKEATEGEVTGVRKGIESINDIYTEMVEEVKG